jgi:hypothetical protein
MSVSFGGATVPRCQQETHGFDIKTNDTLLLSGKHDIQSSTEYGYNPSFQCIGYSSEIDSLIALIGTVGTLVINGSSYSNMYIKTLGSLSKVSHSSYFKFEIAFVRHTA